MGTTATGADHPSMNIQAQTALELQSWVMFDARAQVMQAQAAPAPADAAAATAQNADVILTLSAAAQNLRTAA